MNSLRRGLAALGLMVACTAAHAANIIVQNGDMDMEGFNDPTPVQPVGDNVGTTLGQQRLIAMQFAADLLGQRLVSVPDIVVSASFDELDCGTVVNTGFTNLGAAGPSGFVLYEDEAPPGVQPNVFYPLALANALVGSDLSGGAEIGATFNSAVDDPECLGDIDWYYGLDAQAGDDLSFIETATHELIHGLGFLTLTDLDTGAFPASGGGMFAPTFPDIFATFIFDVVQGATWPELLAVQRSLSARNDGNVVWNGPSSIANAAPTLDDGVNQGRVQLYAPAAVEEGSSISHWDTAVTPNALMEPFEQADVSVLDGIGISACLLQDLGWTLSGNGFCPDRSGVTPGPPGMPGIGDPGAGPGGAGGSPVVANSSSGGGGGGGCSLGHSNHLDPIWITSMGLAWLALFRRRRMISGESPV